jgi:hypothetical protein
MVWDYKRPTPHSSGEWFLAIFSNTNYPHIQMTPQILGGDFFPPKFFSARIHG